MLLGVRIRNFALLKEFVFGITADDLERERLSEIGQSLFPLKRMSAIIGRNNVGKTIFFEALDFLGDCLRYNVAYASNLYQRGGFSKLHTIGSEGNIEFELLYLMPWADELLNYSLEIEGDQHGRPRVIYEKVLSFPIGKELQKFIHGSRVHDAFATDEKPVPKLLLELREGVGGVLAQEHWEETAFADLKAPALATYGRMLKYKGLRCLYQFITGIFFLRGSSDELHGEHDKLLYEQGGHRHINRNASNIRNVLFYLKQENPKEFRKMMRRIESRIPSSQRLDDFVLDCGITSGEARLFVILLLLEDPRPRPLILLENPDTSLYHDMVEKLGNAMRDYSLRSEDVQLFFSTHSSILLEALTPYEVWVLRRPESELKRSYLQMVEDIAPVNPEERAAAKAQAVSSDYAILQSGSKAFCVAASPMVRAMYKEGIGLGALWYSGHFDFDDGLRA